MSCPSSVVLSMFADGELATTETGSVERHTRGCAACSAQVAALKDEAAALRVALHSADDAAPIPRFAPPTRARDFVLLVIGTALVAGLANVIWSAVGAWIPSEIDVARSAQIGSAVRARHGHHQIRRLRGTSMWTATLNSSARRS